ncbi:MAG TPA: UDP-N-acetylglucosamine 2-epimerase, partial [Flavobacterium sp.]|nr:UDP-N-acetylglucosamine 2-epimerase [Flavobacterium sp.]
PAVRDAAKEAGLVNLSNIHIMDPLDYPSLVFAMEKCYLVLTDSGGIQEEAPSLGKPVLVMRDTTERPEGVKAGVAKLVGTDTKKIIFETEKLLTDESEYKKMSNAINPYGDGKTSDKIVKLLSGLL